MKNSIAAIILLSGLTTTVFAAETVYHIFADGLVCRYCAFAADKKLRQVEGVEHVDIFLEKGMINLLMSEGSEITEQQLRELLNDVGITFRRMESHSLK